MSNLKLLIVSDQKQLINFPSLTPKMCFVNNCDLTYFEITGYCILLNEQRDMFFSHSSCENVHCFLWNCSRELLLQRIIRLYRSLSEFEIGVIVEVNITLN